MYPAETRFLVVDDSALQRRVIKNILTELDFTNVFEAGDGQQALELLERQIKSSEPIQVICSDWNMPVMDGFKFLEQVRGNNEFDEVPFIMITSNTDADKALEAVSIGVTNYIVKPITTTVLQRKLDHLWKNFKKHP